MTVPQEYANEKEKGALVVASRVGLPEGPGQCAL
jgi:hypothetical protein